MVAMETAGIVRTIIQKGFPGLFETIYGYQVSFRCKNSCHFSFCMEWIFKIK